MKFYDYNMSGRDSIYRVICQTETLIYIPEGTPVVDLSTLAADQLEPILKQLGVLIQSYIIPFSSSSSKNLNEAIPELKKIISSLSDIIRTPENLNPEKKACDIDYKATSNIFENLDATISFISAYQSTITQNPVVMADMLKALETQMNNLFLLNDSWNAVFKKQLKQYDDITNNFSLLSLDSKAKVSYLKITAAGFCAFFSIIKKTFHQANIKQENITFDSYQTSMNYAWDISIKYFTLLTDLDLPFDALDRIALQAEFLNSNLDILLYYDYFGSYEKIRSPIEKLFEDYSALVENSDIRTEQDVYRHLSVIDLFLKIQQNKIISFQLNLNISKKLKLIKKSIFNLHENIIVLFKELPKNGIFFTKINSILEDSKPTSIINLIKNLQYNNILIQLTSEEAKNNNHDEKKDSTHDNDEKLNKELIASLKPYNSKWECVSFEKSNKADIEKFLYQAKKDFYDIQNILNKFSTRGIQPAPDSINELKYLLTTCTAKIESFKRKVSPLFFNGVLADLTNFFMIDVFAVTDDKELPQLVQPIVNNIIGNLHQIPKVSVKNSDADLLCQINILKTRLRLWANAEDKQKENRFEQWGRYESSEDEKIFKTDIQSIFYIIQRKFSQKNLTASQLNYINAYLIEFLDIKNMLMDYCPDCQYFDNIEIIIVFLNEIKNNRSKKTEQKDSSAELISEQKHKTRKNKKKNRNKNHLITTTEKEIKQRHETTFPSTQAPVDLTSSNENMITDSSGLSAHHSKKNLIDSDQKNSLRDHQQKITPRQSSAAVTHYPSQTSSHQRRLQQSKVIRPKQSFDIMATCENYTRDINALTEIGCELEEKSAQIRYPLRLQIQLNRLLWQKRLNNLVDMISKLPKNNPNKIKQSCYVFLNLTNLLTTYFSVEAPADFTNGGYAFSSGAPFKLSELPSPINKHSIYPMSIEYSPLSNYFVPVITMGQKLYQPRSIDYKPCLKGYPRDTVDGLPVVGRYSRIKLDSINHSPFGQLENELQIFARMLKKAGGGQVMLQQLPALDYQETKEKTEDYDLSSELERDSRPTSDLVPSVIPQTQSDRRQPQTNYWNVRLFQPKQSNKKKLTDSTAVFSYVRKQNQN